MSAFGLEGAPYLFSQTGTFPAPYTFTVPATLEVRTDMASASFDGSGASGSWLPAVSFYSPSGVRLGTFPCQGTPLAMGASAEVTWFPLGLAASSAAAPGGGIQYGIDPQPGSFLAIDASSYIDFESDSQITVNDNGGGGLYLNSAAGGAGGGFVQVSSSGEVFITADEIVLRNDTGGEIQFQNTAGGNFAIFDPANGEIFILPTGATFEIYHSFGAPIFVVYADGRVALPTLPTSPGSTGELYVDALGFVKQA